MLFCKVDIMEKKSLSYLGHSLELSILEKDVDRLTERVADTLTTAVNVFRFKEKCSLQHKKTCFDKDVKKA